MSATAEQVLAGDRNDTIMAMVIARTWRDPDYKSRLLQDPREVLAQEGLEFPPDVALEILQDTMEVKHVAVPRDVTDAGEVASVLQGAFPLLEGERIVLIQNNDEKHYLVLPTAPIGIDVEQMSDRDLIKLLPRGSFTVAIYTTAVAVLADITAVAAATVAVGAVVFT